MAIYSKEILSGSTDGRPIKVVATATPGTTIHTAHATAKDELWLYAVPSSGADETLTIELGGVTSPDDLIIIKVKKEVGPVLVVAGVPLTNSVVVRAFNDSANDVNIFGYVNRIT